MTSNKKQYSLFLAMAIDKKTTITFVSCMKGYNIPSNNKKTEQKKTTPTEDEIIFNCETKKVLPIFLHLFLGFKLCYFIVDDDTICFSLSCQTTKKPRCSTEHFCAVNHYG